MGVGPQEKWWVMGQNGCHIGTQEVILHKKIQKWCQGQFSCRAVLSAVSQIVNEWEFYKDFIMGLSLEDYRDLLSKDGEYGGSMELASISYSFPQYIQGDYN